MPGAQASSEEDRSRIMYNTAYYTKYVCIFVLRIIRVFFAIRRGIPRIFYNTYFYLYYYLLCIMYCDTLVTAVSRTTLRLRPRPASAPPPSGNAGSTDYGPRGCTVGLRTCAPAHLPSCAWG